MFGRNRYLLKPEGDAPAGGGAPADPLFDPPAPPAPPTGTPPAPPTGTPPAPPAPGATPDWRAGMPEDLRKQPFMDKYQTPEALAKAYGNLEKMIGADKIAVPMKGTALADMREVFEKLGVPKEVADYKIEVANPDKFDPNFITELGKQAHALGVLPAQAKGLADWFEGISSAAYRAQTELKDKANAADLEAFKTEAGDTYSAEIARAKTALNSLSKQDQEFIQKSGLSKNVTMLRLLAKFGATMDEGSIKNGGTPTGVGGLNPAQAREKIDEVKKSGLKHPYYDKNHADHEKSKKEMQALYAAAFPAKNSGNPAI